MTSPTGPPDGGAGDGDAPQQDPSELGEAIRTGRVPVAPGSLVELVMRSGISSGDEEQPGDAPPDAREPSAQAPPASPVSPDPSASPTPPTPSTPPDPPTRARPAAERPPAEPLEDADLGDLGDDPLGLGPVHAGPPTGPPADPERTDAAAPAADDTPSPPPAGASGAVTDPGPVTAPGDVVPPPIAPPPAPVPEPATGPNQETGSSPAVGTPGGTGGPVGTGEESGAHWSLFGDPRPLPDGPETDVLPGMAFGRVAGRYPAADPVSSTGRTTMPGRRRPAPRPGPGDTPPPAPRPTMPGPAGPRPEAGDPPRSAPPPAYAPDLFAAGDRDTAANGAARPRPADARGEREPEEPEVVSSTATTGVIAAVTDDGPSPARRADDPVAGYEADTRTWSPGHAPDGNGDGNADGAAAGPGPAHRGGVPGPPAFHRRPPDAGDARHASAPGDVRATPAAPGAGRAPDPRTSGPHPTGTHPVVPGTGRNPAAPGRPGPRPAPPHATTSATTAAGTGTVPARPDASRSGEAVAAEDAADVVEPGSRAAADTFATGAASPPPATSAPGPDAPAAETGRSGSSGSSAADGAAESPGDAAARGKPAKKVTPPRDAIMSAKPRHGRGVSLGGLAIGLAAVLLATLTIWAIIAPSTPDPKFAGGAGPGADSPAAQALRPAGAPPAASRPDPAVRATVPVAQHPQDVAVSPGGRFAYLAVRDAPRLVVLDAAADTVTAEIPLPGPPRSVEMSPDGARAFVSMSDDDAAVNLLGVVDVVGNRLLSTMPVGPEPGGAVPSPDGRFVYLAARGSGEIAEIDPTAGVQTRSVPIPQAPYAIAPSAQGDELYVANHGSGRLTVLDPNTLSVRGTYPVTGDAQAVAASPTAKQVAVAGPDTDRVAVLDPADGREIASVRVDGGPTALAFAPDGRHLYVTAGDTLTVVDTGSWTEVGSVPVGPDPTAVAVAPDGRTAWVTNAQGGSVSVLTLA